MPPCIDAQLVIAPSVIGSLLQLPQGWRTPAIRIRPDQLVEVDVVFPDGPSDHAPIRLVPYFRKVWHADGGAIALDRLEVVSALADRPAKPGRRAWSPLT